jgi:hypothetical protein
MVNAEIRNAGMNVGTSNSDRTVGGWPRGLRGQSPAATADDLRQNPLEASEAIAALLLARDWGWN